MNFWVKISLLSTVFAFATALPRGGRAIKNDVGTNVHNRALSKGGKGGKGGKCAKLEYELKPLAEYEGVITITEHVNDGTGPQLISTTVHDTDIEETDKIKSCDERCLDKDTAEMLSVEVCVTPDGSANSFGTAIEEVMEKLKFNLNGEKLEWNEDDMTPPADFDADCCTVGWSIYVPDSIDVTCGAWRRQLGAVKIPSTENEILGHLAVRRANPEGTFVRKEHLLSPEACDAAIKVLDKAYDKEGFDYEALDKTSQDPLNLPPHAHYVVQLTGSELVDIFGKEEAKKLVDFYTESIGRTPVVTTIKVQRSDNKEQDQYLEFHTDRGDAMVVFLGGKDLVGGGLNYMNKDGVVSSGFVTPGTALVHKHDVLHGSMEWTGIRYMLIFYSEPEAGPEECLLKNVSL